MILSFPAHRDTALLLGIMSSWHFSVWNVSKSGWNSKAGQSRGRACKSTAWPSPINDPGKVQHFAWVLERSLFLFPSPVSVSLSFFVCGLLATCRNERMVTSLSVGSILEQGNVTFSNTYKNWPVCGYGLCVMNTVLLASCYSTALHHNKMWVMSDDVCIWTQASISRMYSSRCIQIRKHKPSCVLYLIIDLKCKSHRSSFVECCSLHPLSTALWRQSSLKWTSQNTLPSTSVASRSSACTQWITKSHSSPVHVNETQAPLSSSKALLSADSYHFTSGLRASHGQARLQWAWKLLFHSYCFFRVSARVIWARFVMLH